MPATDRTITPIQLLATIASLTQQGGRVSSATSDLKIIGLAVARVGDTVTYPDGSEASIVSGAGSAAVSAGKPLALVGSRLGNGDTITTETLQTGRGICERPGEPINGLFDAAYVPPPPIPGDQFAVYGPVKP